MNPNRMQGNRMDVNRDRQRRKAALQSQLASLRNELDMLRRDHRRRMDHKRHCNHIINNPKAPRDVKEKATRDLTYLRSAQQKNEDRQNNVNDRIRTVLFDLRTI